MSRNIRLPEPTDVRNVLNPTLVSENKLREYVHQLLRVLKINFNDIYSTIDNLPKVNISFETLFQNLEGFPHVLTYTGDVLTTVVYTTDLGEVTATYNYTSDKLTSVVLSGATPLGINLTKTLTYTGDNLTGVSYS